MRRLLGYKGLPEAADNNRDNPQVWVAACQANQRMISLVVRNNAYKSNLRKIGCKVDITSLAYYNSHSVKHKRNYVD